MASLSRDFNKQPLTDDEIALRMLATAAYESKLTPAQDQLHNAISLDAVFDPKKFTMTYTIPAGTDEKDLKAVLKMIDVSSDPAMTIHIVRAMPRDPDIVAKAGPAALKRVADGAGMGDDPSLQDLLKKVRKGPKTI